MKIAIVFQSEIKYPFQYKFSVYNGNDSIGIQYTGVMHEGNSIECELPEYELARVKPG